MAHSLLSFHHPSTMPKYTKVNNRRIGNRGIRRDITPYKDKILELADQPNEQGDGGKTGRIQRYLLQEAKVKCPGSHITSYLKEWGHKFKPLQHVQVRHRLFLGFAVWSHTNHPSSSGREMGLKFPVSDSDSSNSTPRTPSRV